MAGQRPFVQTPLNLILPIAPGHAGELALLLAKCEFDPKKPLRAALTRLGNVHYAQFMILDLLPRLKHKDLPPFPPEKQDFRLGVFTIYDGDFDDYILSFVEHIGPIFDEILTHIEGASGLLPVRAHREAFLEFITAHDSTGLGVFCAYPGLRAFDIRDAEEKVR